MRIVCPICGEEPVKGQRHFCRGMQAPRQQVELELEREPSSHYVQSAPSCTGHHLPLRRGAQAGASAVCASIASLVSKNPALWRSGSALVRCSADDFVAGLLALAVAGTGWHKDPKREIVCTLLGKVADEAARALQGFWRRHLSTRAPRQVKGPDGFTRLNLPHHLVSAPTAPVAPQNAAAAPLRPVPPRAVRKTSDEAGVRSRPPPLNVAVPSREVPCAAHHTGGSGTSTSSSGPPVLASPRQQETPRNKSNPRPSGGRAVPLNPIQALKHRKMQQQKEAEDKRIQNLLEAEEWRARRAQNPGGSAPPSPQGSLQAAIAATASSDGSAGKPTAIEAPEVVVEESGFSTTGGILRAALCEDQSAQCQESGMSAESNAMLTPKERRALRQDMQSSPRDPALRNTGAGGSQPPPLPRAPIAGESSSAPMTLERWRSPAAGAERGSDSPSTPRSRSCAPVQSPGESGSATARLQERMRQRQTSTGRPPQAAAAPSGVAGASGLGTSSSSWQERIEMRQREAQEMQDVESEYKQKTVERSSRRNDAMRRVMERQAQRQQDVDQLEA